MKIRSLCVLFIAIVFGCLVQSSSAQNPVMIELRDAWRAGNYQKALFLGSQIRNSKTNQTAELDYIIGTSACQLGQGDLGKAYLAWCSKNYDIAEADRPKIALAISRCGEPAEPERLMLASVKSGQVGVMWRLKTYNMLPTNAAVRTKLPDVVKTFTPEELSARRFPLTEPQQALKQGLNLAGTNFSGVVAGRFVIIGQGEVTTRMAQVATRAEEFYRREYGLFLPASVVTVYLAPSIPDLHQMGVNLHGFKLPDQCIGYSQQDDLSMVIIPSEGTLRHELFHLMARSSFGDIPPWLDEGMAALYEVSTEKDNSLRGVNSWRAEVFKTVNQHPAIADLIAMDWTAFSPNSTEGQAINEASARYFLLYLQEQDQLTEVFKAFHERQPANLKIQNSTNAVEIVGNDARKTLEASMRRPMAKIESSFRTWLTSRIK